MAYGRSTGPEYMALTNNQIERYSRQIIVPGIGGRAQEKLLASCVALVAEPVDAAGALAYLVGAGVGRIVVHPVADPASYGETVEAMRDLNPDVRVAVAGAEASKPSGFVPDLLLALISGEPGRQAAARIWDSRRSLAESTRSGHYCLIVIARLDEPGRIAILPAPPPCPLCVDTDLLTPTVGRGVNSGVVAMVAVVETFKLLAGFAGRTTAAEIIEFTGYACTPRALGRRPSDGGQARCACEAS